MGSQHVLCGHRQLPGTLHFRTSLLQAGFLTPEAHSRGPAKALGVQLGSPRCIEMRGTSESSPKLGLLSSLELF